MRIPKLLTRAVGATKLFCIKNGPALLIYGGIVVVGVGIVLACKASTRVNEEIEAHEEALEDISDKYSDASVPSDSAEERREIFAEKRHFAWQMVKLYGPSVTIIITGFIMILSGNHIIHQRNAALAAAYNLLEEGYNKYRERVRADIGEDKDREYYYGLENRTVEKITNDIDGNPHKVKDTAMIVKSPGDPSVYARFFDEYSSQWTDNPEYNLMFLRSQQNYANDKLHAQGHLFLNEVYEMLGMPHTQAGAVVGWVLNRKNSDNCVDFGIYNLHDDIKRCFVNGYEPSILLDFNVDGVIYDLI